MTRLAALILLLLALSTGTAQGAVGDRGHGGPGDEGNDVRVEGTCGRGAAVSLRLRGVDDKIEVRLRIRQTAGRGVWRITIVHENRISSRTAVNTTRADDSFELRRTLSDLSGSDTVIVHAWGPKGLGCRAKATLPADA